MTPNVKRSGAIVVLLAAIAAVAVAASMATAASSAGAPIIIGYPTDLKGNMAPFDGPALAAAQLQIKKINAKGGVAGRPLQIITCDTQNSNPAKAKACAASLIAKGAVVGMVTCDVEFAAPAVQTFIIPVSAIIFRRQGTQVGTVGSDNVAHLLPVTIGQDDGTTVQIVSGLKAGDRVIQDPPDSLIEGERVSPQNPNNQGNDQQPGAGAK